jgi:hypothetical protein
MNTPSEVGDRQRKHEASPHHSPRVELPHDGPNPNDLVGDSADVVEDNVEEEGSRRAKKRPKVNHGMRIAGLTWQSVTDSHTHSLRLLPSFGERHQPES